MTKQEDGGGASTGVAMVGVRPNINNIDLAPSAFPSGMRPLLDTDVPIALFRVTMLDSVPAANG